MFWGVLGVDFEVNLISLPVLCVKIVVGFSPILVIRIKDSNFREHQKIVHFRVVQVSIDYRPNIGVVERNSTELVRLVVTGLSTLQMDLLILIKGSKNGDKVPLIQMVKGKTVTIYRRKPQVNFGSNNRTTFWFIVGFLIFILMILFVLLDILEMFWG